MMRCFYVMLSFFSIFCHLEGKDNLYIITGGPGSGKSTLIEELKRRGIFCVEEVARKVIQEEVQLGCEALLGQRIEKMIVRSLETYEDAVVKRAEVTIFDRGVLDYISYANRTHTPISKELIQKAAALNYNKIVFMAPPWEEIYCNDSERKQSFEEALEVYETLVKIYSEYGYEIIELPKTDVQSRADFLLRHIAENT